MEFLNSLKQDRSRYSELFASWLRNGGAEAKDEDAILKPDAIRVHALQNCMRKLATEKAPLILVMDTCEVIAGDLEEWMRLLVAPLCDGNTPFLALMGSRLPPDAAEAPGSCHLWRAAMEEERWRSAAFDEGVRFTVQEITDSLKRAKPVPKETEKLAEQLHRITLGVPLALRSLIDLHQEDSDVLTKLDVLDFPQGDESAYQEAEQRVVEVVSARFLLHLSDREERKPDFRDIIALALIPEFNREVLKQLWHTENVTGRLRELARRYALLAAGDLHATVRSFLRRCWRTEDRPALVGDVIAQLRAASEKIHLPDQPGDTAHMKTVAIRLNAIGWQNGAGSLSQFAPAIAIALAFDEHVHALVDLAAELEQTDQRPGVPQIMRKFALQLRSGLGASAAWGNEEVLAWLEKQEREATWSQIEKAALDLLKGLKRVAFGMHREALEFLLSALEVFGDRPVPPRRDLFGEAFFEIGFTLYANPQRRADVLSAYRGASRLGYAEAQTANNSGLIVAHIGRREEAEQLFHKAMVLNPEGANVPTQSR